MTSGQEILQRAIAQIPSGRWGVAVSGGSDSVALLHLARMRDDLHLHAIHLDHETRAGESTLDANFVRELCHALVVPLSLARRSEIEPHLADLPANLQARYRMVRLEHYRRTISAHRLDGVLQAHHADDQAETILMRLVRGTGIEGLCGIAGDTSVEGMRIFRPLLHVRKAQLQSYLRERDLSWREDSSNASPKYRRNHVRQLLQRHPQLVEALLKVQVRFAQLAAELDAIAPTLADEPSLRELAKLHPLVQMHALRKWAIAHGALADDLTIELLTRVQEMVEDMASAPSVCLPGGVEVRRRSGALVTRRSARSAPPASEPGLEDPS